MAGQYYREQAIKDIANKNLDEPFYKRAPEVIDAIRNSYASDEE